MASLSMTMERKQEDRVTDLLLDAVGRLSPKGQRLFVSRALGVQGLPPKTGKLEIARRTRTMDTRRTGDDHNVPEARAVLVMLTGKLAISESDPNRSPGSEVDGILLWRGELAVLLESKIGANTISRRQVYAHTVAWGLDVEAVERLTDSEDQDLPDGFGWVTWEALCRVLEDRLPVDEDDMKVLIALARELRAAGVAGGQPAGPWAATAISPAPVGNPVDLEAILSSVDLYDVYMRCQRMYGTGGTYAVDGSSKAEVDEACRVDKMAVIQAFEKAQLLVPPGLVGTPMTPRRLISWALQETGTMLSGPDRAVVTRLTSRGADRRVVVALWAFACHGGPSNASKIKKNLAKAWPRLPPTTPAAPELDDLNLDPEVLAQDR